MRRKHKYHRDEKRQIGAILDFKEIEPMNTTEQATMIIRHSVGDEYLHPLLEQRIAAALVAAHAAGLEAAEKVAVAEREKSEKLWQGVASLPVRDTSAMKVYNGRQLAAASIENEIRAIRTAAAKGETPGNEARNQ